MSRQTTLLTSHKGVDLHAASAVRVMRDRLTGGDRLVALYRCELHTFWDGDDEVSLARLLDNGRYYNPNKHHYGHFACDDGGRWPEGAGGELAAAWPGTLRGTDLTSLDGRDTGLYDRLLGGPVAAGAVAVDVAAWPRDDAGPVLSGVLWRLVLAAPPAEARALGEQLAVARSRKDGLLLNPHMENWRTAVRRG